MQAHKNPDSTQLYLNQIGKAPLLTAKEEVYYSRKQKEGDMAARQRMIESNLRLVVKIVRRYLNRGLPLLDLIEEGNLGLIRAVEKYDPEKGFRFSTYATYWIKQFAERAIKNHSRTIRLPIDVVKELKNGDVQLLKRAYIPTSLDSEKLSILGRDVAGLINAIGHNIYQKDEGVKNWWQIFVNVHVLKMLRLLPLRF